MKIIVFIVFLISYLTSVASALNVLVVDTVFVTSHQIWNYNIVEELLKKGHNVTLIGNMSIKPIKHINYTMLELSGLGNSLEESNLIRIDNMLSLGTIENIFLIFDFDYHLCVDALRSSALKKLLDYPKDFYFDLILMDISCGECMYPLIQRFNYPPTIGLTPFLLPPPVSEAFGNVMNPSYQPHFVSTLTNKMTFTQRIKNWFYYSLYYSWKKYVILPKDQELVKSCFGKDTQNLLELGRHISLVLCNYMAGFHYSIPFTPNIIPVGGLQIKPGKKLPKDLQSIVDSSPNGFILFSLGTFIRTDEFSPKKINIILNALGRFNETVIWKTNLNLKNLPKNVLTKEWLPQRDLLANPNIKAFFSHCGGLSSMEAAYHGVPVIGMPFVVDQHHLCALISAREMGKVLDFRTITSEEIYKTIREVIDNPKYRTNAKSISAAVRDQKETPLERALFWIEWVIRNNGSHILDPYSRDLPYFITSSLDIYLFLLVMFIIILFVIKYLMLIIKELLKKNWSKINYTKNKTKLN